MKLYKATNKLNGKSYIGVALSVKSRRKKHFYDAEHDSPFYFHRAIRKYGEDAFVWKTITNYDTCDAAYKAEIQMIAEYKTFGENGYNMTAGGEGSKGMKHTKQAKEKIAAARIGVPLSEKHKQNISKGRKGVKHKPMSDEHKSKISKALTGIKKVSQKIVKCPHCSKSGGISPMHYWHFDNCKMRQNNETF